METIDQLLSLQLNNFTELDCLLNEEKELLAHRETEPLMNLVMRKKDLIDKIAAADTEIKTHPDSDSLTSDAKRNHVTSLKAMLLQCQKKSAINEEIVNQSLHSMERLGKVLTEVRSTNLTYDASAKKISLSGNSLKNVKA